MKGKCAKEENLEHRTSLPLSVVKGVGGLAGADVDGATSIVVQRGSRGQYVDMTMVGSSRLIPSLNIMYELSPGEVFVVSM